MVIEEMNELQNELCKYLRGQGNIERIVGELADVEIMLGQAKMLYGIEDQVKAEKERKLEMLEWLLAQDAS
jgi:hypothetical protein